MIHAHSTLDFTGECVRLRSRRRPVLLNLRSHPSSDCAAVGVDAATGMHAMRPSAGSRSTPPPTGVLSQTGPYSQCQLYAAQKGGRDTAPTCVGNEPEQHWIQPTNNNLTHTQTTAKKATPARKQTDDHNNTGSPIYDKKVSTSRTGSSATQTLWGRRRQHCPGS